MPAPKLLIVYLHGFRSSPNSSKAQLTGEAIASLVKDGQAIEWYCPQLPPSPQAAMTMVKQKIAETKAKDLCIIGSSLGGFYATCNDELFDQLAADARKKDEVPA